MNLHDEIEEYLQHDCRKSAKPKPKYFWGEHSSIHETGRGHYDDIPEEQFWNPEKKEKHE